MTTNTCKEIPYQCPEMKDVPCQNAQGYCNKFDGVCYYEKSNECKREGESCLIDRCEAVEGEAKCYYETIKGCIDNAEHEVEFAVMEQNKLDLELLNKKEIKLCHSTFYRGEESVALLSFTPYELNTLRARGSCDNRLNVVGTVLPVFNLLESKSNTLFPCIPHVQTNTPNHYPFAIPGLPGNDFMWSQVPLPPTLVIHDVTKKMRVHGYIVSPSDPLFLMAVDLHFEKPLVKASSSPYLGMYPSCYNGANQKVNPKVWSYYETWYGTMYAMQGSPYHGLTLDLSASKVYPQLGYGANGVNAMNGIYAEFDWVIVAQPYDKKRMITGMNSKVVFKSDVVAGENTKLPYADLFGEPHDSPVNGWNVQLLNNMDLVQYCRIFTLYELLACRNATDPYSMLFEYAHDDEEEGTVTYRGSLFSTNLKLGDDGEEQILDSAIFNMTVVVGVDGLVDARRDTAHLDVQIIWDENVWVRGSVVGNLKINFRTRILHEDLHLARPSLDATTERGYPMVFDDSSDASPVCQYVDGYCEQSWTLRTFCSEYVTDFSGQKSLSWDVIRNGVAIQKAHARMSVKAFHVGDQSHLSDTMPITAQFKLYTDREFRMPLDDTVEGNMLDGTTIYGNVCLDVHEHLDLYIKEIYLCYSEEADTLPIDPLHFMDTGCLTPGINVQEVLIYTSEMMEESMLTPDWKDYQVNKLFYPPDSANCEGFSFKVKANTPYRQSIQVVWRSQENGGVGGMVELLSERLHHRISSTTRYSVNENEAVEHFHFHVHCGIGYHYNSVMHACVMDNSFIGDDDDSFDGYYHVDSHVDAVWFVLFGIGILLLIFVCFNNKLIRQHLFNVERAPSSKKSK